MLLSEFQKGLENMTPEEKDKAFKEFVEKTKQEENKNKSIKLIFITSGLFILLILVSGISYNYFSTQMQIKAQAAAEQKEKEETRFITALDDDKSIYGSSIVDILNATLKNTKWSQSQISDNKYTVECTGEEENDIISFSIDVIDNGSDV